MIEQIRLPESRRLLFVGPHHADDEAESPFAVRVETRVNLPRLIERARPVAPVSASGEARQPFP